MMIFNFFDSPMWYRLGVSLVHFLWQGLVVGMLAIFITALFSRHSARRRYGIYVVSLIVMVVSVGVTLPLVEVPAKHLAVADNSTEIPSSLTPVDQIETVAVTVNPLEPVEVSDSAPLSTDQKNTAEKQARGIIAGLASAWHLCLPYLMGTYCCGVIFLSLRVVFALRGGQLLRRDSTPVDDPVILTKLTRQAQLLGMRFMPALAYCECVIVPTVVGVIRPTILLPVTFATGLTAEQVEMLLAHELAHIRRLDPLVNLFQRVVEALLFFHPMVWFISHRVRVERENSCDDIVLSTGGSAESYALSLVEMARQALSQKKGIVMSAQSLSATGKPSQLRERIQRLLLNNQREHFRLKRTWVLIAIVGIALAGACASQVDEDRDDSTQKSTLRIVERCSEARRAAEEKIHDLHIVTHWHMQRRDPVTGQWENTPSRAHTRSWHESLEPGARFRIDYDPEILKWIDGASPYAENRFTLLWDGTEFRKIDHIYGPESGAYVSRVTERYRHLPDPKRGILEKTERDNGLYLMRSAPADMGLGGMDLASFVKMVQHRFKDAQVTTDKDGVLVVVHMNFEDNKLAFTFDPRRAYALVKYTRNSSSDKTPTVIDEVSEWTQLDSGVWLPSKWHHYFLGGQLRYSYRMKVADHYSPDDADAIFAAKDINIGTSTQTAPSGFVSNSPGAGPVDGKNVHPHTQATEVAEKKDSDLIEELLRRVIVEMRNVSQTLTDPKDLAMVYLTTEELAERIGDRSDTGDVAFVQPLVDRLKQDPRMDSDEEGMFIRQLIAELTKDGSTTAESRVAKAVRAQVEATESFIYAISIGHRSVTARHEEAIKAHVARHLGVAGQDEKAIRQAISALVESAKQNDEQATASILNPRTIDLSASRVITILNGIVELGATPDNVNSINIHDNRALVATDFFEYADPQTTGMQCVVYELARSGKDWLINDIDLEDADGLIREVRYFDSTTERPTTRPSSLSDDGQPIVPARRPVRTAGMQHPAVMDGDSTIELVGVSHNQTPPGEKKWWRPDGSALMDRPYEALGTYYNSKRPYEFAVRVTGDHELDIRVKTSSPLKASEILKPRRPSSGDAEGVYGFVIMNYPPEAKETDIELSVALGPWRKEESFDVPSGERDPYVINNESSKLILLPPRQDGNDVIAEISHSYTDDAARLVITDHDGHVHIPDEDKSGGRGEGISRRIYRYKGMHLADVKTLEFQRRIFHHSFEFNHVSLERGHQTNYVAGPAEVSVRSTADLPLPQ